MLVALSDLKADVGKYVDLAEKEEVIVTKYGKPAAKIVRYDKEPWYSKKIPEKITSIEQLFGTLPNDIDLNDKCGNAQIASLQKVSGRRLATRSPHQGLQG